MYIYIYICIYIYMYIYIYDLNKRSPGTSGDLARSGLEQHRIPGHWGEVPRRQHGAKHSSFDFSEY